MNMKMKIVSVVAMVLGSLLAHGGTKDSGDQPFIKRFECIDRTIQDAYFAVNFVWGNHMYAQLTVPEGETIVSTYNSKRCVRLLDGHPNDLECEVKREDLHFDVQLLFVGENAAPVARIHDRKNLGEPIEIACTRVGKSNSRDY